MGCSETKNLPSLMFVFEPQNDKQKQYCIKLKDSLLSFLSGLLSS
jgi:hypothetical protein